MPLENATPGGDYHDFELDCQPFNASVSPAGATVLHRIIEHQPKTVIGENECEPVVVDFVILDGPNKGLVRRGERIIGRGMTSTLRRSRVGAEIATVAAWSPKPGRNGKHYQCFNPAPADRLAFAKEVYAKTGNDPWLAAERAAMANPLENATPAPVATPAAQVPAGPTPEQIAAQQAAAALAQQQAAEALAAQQAAAAAAAAQQPAMSGAPAAGAVPDAPW